MTKLVIQRRAAKEISPRLLLGTAIVVLFLAGCTSTSPSSSSNSASSSVPAATTSGLPDPCSLVTQEEVEIALGKGATKTSIYNERINTQQCRMKPAAPGAIDTVIMSVKNADLWDGMKKAVLPPNSDAKLVTGLGDDAFMNRAIGYNVRKGNRYIQIFGSLTNNDAANEKATRYLAERAASRL